MPLGDSRIKGVGVPARTGVGLSLALTSSATFALSGMFASALIDTGWSPGAVTTYRIAIAGAVLLIPALLVLGGRWSVLKAARWHIVAFAVFAVAVAQLGFFSAVQYIPPALALLIEFLGPVLLAGWTWARTRISPSGKTLTGIVFAVAGLVLISGIGGAGLHPLGLLFALTAAIGNAVYWATAASGTHGLPPVTLAGLGLAGGGVLLAAATIVGVLPFRTSGTDAVLAGVAIPVPLAIGGLALIATVTPYVLGVAGARRLGATVASFAGYSEPLFAIVWMALLLGTLPTPMQWVGAATLIAGVVLVKVGEVSATRRATEPVAVTV